MCVCVCLCVCVCTLSRVKFFVAPWTVAHPAPLSMEFFRQENWGGLPFPSPENLPNLGIEPTSPAPPALAGNSLPLGSPRDIITTRADMSTTDWAWWNTQTKAMKQLFPDTGNTQCRAIILEGWGTRKVSPMIVPTERHLPGCVSERGNLRDWRLTEWRRQRWGFREAKVARICAVKYQRAARKERYINLQRGLPVSGWILTCIWEKNLPAN